jgi:hypothetical protein
MKAKACTLLDEACGQALTFAQPTLYIKLKLEDEIAVILSFHVSTH